MIPDNKLEESELFKNWKEEHKAAFLSHYFCQVDSEFKLKGPWEVGYYEPSLDKIQIFVLSEEVTLKKEDQVFKKPGDKVQKLDLGAVKLSFEEALEVFKGNYKELFPNVQLGDGFVILQTIGGKTLWNFTYITKTIKFMNIKINSFNGEVDSHQEVELVHKS